jgi:hypothetical protein
LHIEELALSDGQSSITSSWACSGNTKIQLFSQLLHVINIFKFTLAMVFQIWLGSPSTSTIPRTFCLGCALLQTTPFSARRSFWLRQLWQPQHGSQVLRRRTSFGFHLFQHHIVSCFPAEKTENWSWQYHEKKTHTQKRNSNPSLLMTLVLRPTAHDTKWPSVTHHQVISLDRCNLGNCFFVL